MKILDASEINISHKDLELREIIVLSQKMELLCVKDNIPSLSAVQVGINYNFFIYSIDYCKNYKYMMDCEYTAENDEKFISIEGCQSIFSNKTRYQVERYQDIIVKGKELIIDDRKTIDFSRKFTKDLECCIFQHEIDHYNNILINKIGKEIYIQERIQV